MAENIGHTKSTKFGGTPVMDNPEPSHTGTMSDGRCNDYGVSPTIIPTRKVDTRQGRQWQSWETHIISQFFNGEYDNVSLFDLLPHRSKLAIRHKAHRLGFRYFRWDALRTYNELTNEEIAYIAGIIDGEGYIGIVKPKPFKQICITISNTDFNLLNWLKAKLGGGISNDKRIRENRKLCRSWQMTRYTNCINLLKKIYPHLIVKKCRVDEIV